MVNTSAGAALWSVLTTYIRATAKRGRHCALYLLLTYGHLRTGGGTVQDKASPHLSNDSDRLVDGDVAGALALQDGRQVAFLCALKVNGLQGV
jgi:hypothetical protein